MVTEAELAERRRALESSAELRQLLARLGERARPVLDRLPVIPDAKALLSSDGGVCPRDGTTLEFDPWSAHAHRCPRCGEQYGGERHDRWWARFQHLWLAERAAHLATLAVLGDDKTAAARSGEILREYADRYLRYSNCDNVLGPSRLFFSTYLESLWICNYLSAAQLLREAGMLDESTSSGVAKVADEAANLIGEFDELFSNRQTWNNAALVAIAVWFEDEDLARRAIEGETGLIAHLARAFGRDGMWYEGENYHLFALRGLLTGAGWALHAGVDLIAAPEARARMRAALRAPAISALPNFTYPPRKDSRFGVSLAHPAYLELWEIGAARLEIDERAELLSWLKTLYESATPNPELLDFYLHDAPASGTARPGRTELSWWSLLEMLPALPADLPAWAPQSELLEAQGLAVLRRGTRYASLECGPRGGGHGHDDRLNLTLYADATYWLPDMGTGSYVTRDLAWFRSTLAHNAPRLDARSQPLGSASCEAFDEQGDWAWARGRFGDLVRTVVAGPAYLVDVLDLATREEHLLEIAWHFAGEDKVVTSGRWEPAELKSSFVSTAERLVPESQDTRVIELRASHSNVRAWLLGGELLRGVGPGRLEDGTTGDRRFYLIRTRGRSARLVTVIEQVNEASPVRAVRAKGDLVEVETARGVDRHVAHAGAWNVDLAGGGTVRLGGRRDVETPFQPFISIDPPGKAFGSALRIGDPPALDGTLDGFDTGEPLSLDVEDQYRRSEEPYGGPEQLSAVAYVNWMDEALFVAVEVTKPDICFRPPDAPPLLLDNQPDDIHSDGVQLYVQGAEGHDALGFLIVPEEGGRGLRIHAVAGMAGKEGSVRGAWTRTEAGYCVTVALPWPEDVRPHPGGKVNFDLLVNEMLPDRIRRAGQLVWSGRGGWVWLMSDWQEPSRFGVLDLQG